MCTVNEKWYKLWKASLCLGINLLKGSRSGLIGWSKDEFKQELEKLRQQVKDNLFSTEPSALTKEYAADDKPIANILISIMNTWRDGAKTLEGDFKATIPPTGPVYTKDDRMTTDSQSGLEATIDQRKHRDSRSELGATIDDRAHRDFQSEPEAIRDDRIPPDSQLGLDATIDGRTHQGFQGDNDIYKKTIILSPDKF